MARVWRFAVHDEAIVRELSAALQISPLMAQVLVARNCQNREQAIAFLESKLTDLHDPDSLPGVSEAADRIVAAAKAGRKITVYGDYDVDGMTSSSILWRCLKLENANVNYYIPSRFEEGYGLNSEAIQKFHDDDAEQLVITVDCGITSVTEAALAKKLGLELIITDHHQFAEELPDAAVLVHPRLPVGDDSCSDYPFGDLCGAGVAFKLAWAICKRFGDGEKATPQMREFLKSAVGLAAIGTVADVVPLVGENRVLVRYGLRSLLDRPSPGLRALMEVSDIDLNRELQADDDIGFKIGPRINAAGRLGQARLAVELLTTDNTERAKTLAKHLDDLNKDRRTVEARVMKQAKALVKEHPEWAKLSAIVIAQHDWHAGVIGIVANRIAEFFEKPAVLISLDRETNIGQGSGRSFAGFDLHAGLSACSEHLLTFGGHHAAAGVKVHADHVDAFRKTLSDFVAENHQPTEKELEQKVDAEVRFADITQRAVEELDKLGPFGQANLRPIFSASQVMLAEPPRTMGEGGRHVSLTLKQYNGPSIRAVAFGRGEWAEEMTACNGPINICFTASINHFRGRSNVQLFLKDWRPTEQANAAN